MLGLLATLSDCGDEARPITEAPGWEGVTVDGDLVHDAEVPATWGEEPLFAIATDDGVCFVIARKLLVAGPDSERALDAPIDGIDGVLRQRAPATTVPDPQTGEDRALPSPYVSMTALDRFEQWPDRVLVEIDLSRLPTLLERDLLTRSPCRGEEDELCNNEADDCDGTTRPGSMRGGASLAPRRRRRNRSRRAHFAPHWPDGGHRLRRHQRRRRAQMAGGFDGRPPCE